MLEVFLELPTRRIARAVAAAKHFTAADVLHVEAPLRVQRLHPPLQTKIMQGKSC